jgi:hypothetical protein
MERQKILGLRCFYLQEKRDLLPCLKYQVHFCFGQGTTKFVVSSWTVESLKLKCVSGLEKMFSCAYLGT